MFADTNKCKFTGYVQNVSPRYSKRGKLSTRFTINSYGHHDEVLARLHCVAYSDEAFQAKAMLRPGMRIGVEGKLIMYNWRGHLVVQLIANQGGILFSLPNTTNNRPLKKRRNPYAVKRQKAAIKREKTAQHNQKEYKAMRRADANAHSDEYARKVKKDIEKGILPF